jgi:hypothetical protein
VCADLQRGVAGGLGMPVSVALKVPAVQQAGLVLV